MRDTLDAYRRQTSEVGLAAASCRRPGWETKVRVIDPAARVDPTVTTRAGLPAVVQCASVGPYRPEALRNHNDFKQLYLPVAGVSKSSAGSAV